MSSPGVHHEPDFLPFAGDGALPWVWLVLEILSIGFGLGSVTWTLLFSPNNFGARLIFGALAACVLAGEEGDCPNGT
jgi:hypothetical protein